ncbi:hypothetical protein ACET3X_003073 [Alternaria dauci]|uniref:Ubiquitin-like protease family profile domain-containing protein n=1 Tax=Alternaria dauci TaxID=48095 RepID=A0ABR3URD8_9PLEO
MSLQPNNAVAQSPSGTDLPPNPYSRHSPPAPETSRVVVDLSSPTHRSSRSFHNESHLETSRARLQKSKKSEDEKRLVGDYTRPSDAVDLPDPRSYLPRPLPTKPGSNSGFRPLDTMNTGPNVPSRKPTTYGKRDRPPPPLIGQVHGTGQLAYLHREDRVPATSSRRLSSRDGHQSLSGGALSGKRRKIDHVITLDDDDDDEVLEVSSPVHATHSGTLRGQRHPVRSEQSRMSIGSGSTIGDFRPLQSKSEFREVDSFLKSSQRKPRRLSSNAPKSDLRRSPFGGGALSNSPGTHANRQVILQDFQQGEAKQSPTRCDGSQNKPGPVTTRFFPNARINESTSEQMDQQPASIESAYLRTRHRLAPRQTKTTIDSYSADELAITPPLTESKSPSKQKQKQSANGGVKRNARGKVTEESWPLLFARSSEFEGKGTKSEDGHATLVLKSNRDEGLRVQTWDPVDGCYETQIIMLSKDINNVLADGTSRIRFKGPRRHDGNFGIFDLEFASTPGFFHFFNDYASSMTPSGTHTIKSGDYMAQLFKRPLQPKNEKVGKSILVEDRTEQSENLERKSNGTSNTPLVGQLKSAGDGTAASAMPGATTTRIGSTRPSRARRSAPVQYVEDIPTSLDVPKYSIETGLGRPWARSLEFGEGRQRTIVHFDDLPRLDEEEFLNDSLINFYMIYLFKQLKVPTDKVYFFNTYFFTKLTENSGRKSIDYKAVERWTSKIDIFGYDYIVVPINENQLHWYLAIICNVSKIERKPIVQDFDDPQADVQRQPNDSTTISKSETAATQETTLPLDSPVSIPETQAEPSDEEPNLFDEAVLSLVDRDDTGNKTPHSPVVTQAGSVDQYPEAGSLTVPPVGADAKDTHQRILSDSQLAAPSTKAKFKRKPMPRRDPDQPVVIVLDSLTGNSRFGAVRALKDWIIAEGENKRRMQAVIKENGYYAKDTQIPMQDNWSDCGVYLLGYVEKFFQNPDDFKNKLLTGSMSAREDWPELKPSEMRHKMRQIIFDCYEKQEEERKAQKKAKKGSASSKKSPAPTTHESEDQSGRHTEESQGEEPKLQSSPRNGDAQPTSLEVDSPVRLPPRLGSPFSLNTQRAASAEQSPQRTVGKVSDSPPIYTSPAKQTIVTSRPEETPKRHPEIRIPSKTSRSHGVMRSGQTTSDGWPRPVRAPHQTGNAPDTPSPRKRGRQIDDTDQVESPTSKRQFTMSPRRVHDGDVTGERPDPRSHEGSAPNAPIEIENSQEVEVREENDALERKDAEGSDSVEGISQSTNQLQLDGINDGSVVRETPEPDERGSVAQHGTSRQDPLIL